MKKRYFTLEEARRLLPQVKELAHRMVALAEQLGEYREAIQPLADNNVQNAGSAEGTAYLTHVIALQAVISRVQDAGCLVKGVEEGLVDFPHLKDGREVYLCWKLGEKEILYWHEVDSGFEGRTPIMDPH